MGPAFVVLPVGVPGGRSASGKGDIVLRSIVSMKRALAVLMAAIGVGWSPAFAEEDKTDHKFGKFTRTEAQFLVGDRFKLGSNTPDTNARGTITINHFTKFEPGDLFFFIDFARELDGDRENSIYGEVYAAYDLSKLISEESDQWSWNLAAVAGANIGNTSGALLPGLRLNLKVPGFDLFSLYALAYETFRDGRDRDLKTTYQATFVWNLPIIKDGDVRLLRFSGFLDVRGGRDDTQASTIITQPQIRLDIGHLLFGQPNKYHLGTEFSIVRNKFNVRGVNEFAPQLLFVVQL